MYAYYVVRGHTLGYLLSLPNLEKLFFKEAMEYEIEMEMEKNKTLLGGR